MACVVILLCLLLGAALACAAETFPSHVVPLERCGGTLLVLGLALLGGLLHYVGEVESTKIESKLIRTTRYSDTGALGRIFTAAEPGSAQAATDW
jgi:hypothetical protein